MTLQKRVHDLLVEGKSREDVYRELSSYSVKQIDAEIGLYNREFAHQFSKAMTELEKKYAHRFDETKAFGFLLEKNYRIEVIHAAVKSFAQAEVRKEFSSPKYLYLHTGLLISMAFASIFLTPLFIVCFVLHVLLLLFTQVPAFRAKGANKTKINMMIFPIKWMSIDQGAAYWSPGGGGGVKIRWWVVDPRVSNVFAYAAMVGMSLLFFSEWDRLVGFSFFLLTTYSFYLQIGFEEKAGMHNPYVGFGTFLILRKSRPLFNALAIFLLLIVFFGYVVVPFIW